MVTKRVGARESGSLALQYGHLGCRRCRCLGLGCLGAGAAARAVMIAAEFFLNANSIRFVRLSSSARSHSGAL